MAEGKEAIHIVSGRILVRTWLCLLVLTALTIWVSTMGLGAFSAFAAIFIASIKAILVLMFFMHLKYEPPLFIITSLITVMTLTVIILMTFSDVWFR